MNAAQDVAFARTPFSSLSLWNFLEDSHSQAGRPVSDAKWMELEKRSGEVCDKSRRMGRSEREMNWVSRRERMEWILHRNRALIAYFSV